MKNAFFLTLTLLMSSRSFAEVDAKVAVAQINQEILVSLRGAMNEIAIAKSGVQSSDVETCSSVAVGLNSVKLAQDITGLKEFKKIRVVSKQGAITEFLDFSDVKSGNIVEVVSVQQLANDLKDFYKKNCVAVSAKSKTDCDGVVQNEKRTSAPKDISNQTQKIEEVIKADKGYTGTIPK